MALAPAADAAPPRSDTHVDAPDLRIFVFALFFIFGGITSLNDVLIPKLKLLFTLSYFEVLLVQTAFFAAYFIVSMPGAWVVKRFGYMRAAAIGLFIMTAGCLLFIPASLSALFPAFLMALFVLAAGITIVQVVANPLITLLGPAATASSRLTFAQAFNSLGTTVFPFVGARIILAALGDTDPGALAGAELDAYRSAQTRVIVEFYLVIAAALVAVAALVWARRNRLAHDASQQVPLSQSLDLLRQPRFALGALGIFLYVGAEVAIGSILANYLVQPDALGISYREAGEMVSLYWGGAMVGRFIGAAVLRRFPPPLVLAAVALGAITLIAISVGTRGAVSGYTLIAVGLMNAIMFPTIFTLACAGLGKRAPEGSGLICVAIVGGAIIPPILGLAADAGGLRLGLAVPVLCYLGIALFARHCWRNPVAL